MPTASYARTIVLMVPPLTRDRRTAIARMILGPDAPEPDIAEFADRVGRATEHFPPLSAEQRDVIAVLLRPATTRHGATPQG